MQGVWVQSLVRELDPTCSNKDQTSHIPQPGPGAANTDKQKHSPLYRCAQLSLRKEGIPRFPEADGLCHQKAVSAARVCDFMTLGQRPLESMVIQAPPTQYVVPDQQHWHHI